MDIYDDKTLTIGDIKKRLAYLSEHHKYEPEEDADPEIWGEWEELRVLEGLEGDLHWCWGENNTTLVNATYWQDYCEGLCYDIGDCARDGIVARFVDWAKVADGVAMDYRLVGLPGGNTFYVRG